jgi:hypothetical protein
MDFTKLLILQIIAHLIADFLLQSDDDAKEKNGSGFGSKYLKWHILIIFGISWVLSFQFYFIVGSILIALFHWLIDGLKKEMYKNPILEKYSFFIDQLLHLSIIVLITYFFTLIFELKSIFTFDFSTHYLLMLTGYIICAKPANVFVKEIIKIFNISINKNETSSIDLPNAGKLIGIIERWLVLTFIFLNQFEAVGFLIAAKSILRFKEDATLKTEYVVVGTMLSFCIAIAIGLIITIIDKRIPCC